MEQRNGIYSIHIKAFSQNGVRRTQGYSLGYEIEEFGFTFFSLIFSYSLLLIIWVDLSLRVSGLYPAMLYVNSHPVFLLGESRTLQHSVIVGVSR